MDMSGLQNKLRAVHDRIKKPLGVVNGIKIDNTTWRASSRNLVLKHEVNKFTKEFRHNFITLIVSSFGLVVALTWNEFWNTLIKSLPAESTVTYKLYIAIAMTLAAVIFTYTMSRFKD